MIIQAVPPVPPSMPTPQFDPNLLLMNADSPAIVMIVLAALTAATIVLWPIVRALARRLEGRGGVDAALRNELEQVQHRIAEVDALQIRVAELEERLDFAERLLARGPATPASLQRETS
jgi:Tfp pilus assembly protein PilO